ncbi:MAG: HAMP domain-containing histidine kinase [Clostridia bacterium]|nr:HAMP domain-containing histidine kinase [Clostridia bacterium]
MLKKLKIKFIIITVITLACVVGITVGIINFFNYRSVISEADDILYLIVKNSGVFPSLPGHIDPDIDINFTPESPYESRYFTVAFNGNKLKSVNTEKIAAITDNDAIKMAKSIRSVGIAKGFRGNYRYLMVNEDGLTWITFLDCTKSLDRAHTFLILSISISIICLAVISLISWKISDHAIRPLLENHEKQKRFITDAGHDIKTPITIIDADAELLEMEIGQNEWLSDIKKQTARLATLTGELIYLSRMEEQLIAQHIDFPLSEITEEAVSSFAAPARAKNLTIVKSITPALYYKGDSEAIKKLISILLDNAVKYSPEGKSINIDLKKQGRIIYLKISNYAQNLDDEAVGRMFDRFYRHDSSRSTSGGFGIGLSVAEAIVGSHRGKISAQKQGDLLEIEVIL